MGPGPSTERELVLKPVLNSSVAKLLNLNQSNFDKARIMAVKCELGSSWLKAVPNSACGTRLDDSCVRVSLGLRLDLPILTEYVCLCGANVEPLGYHGLSCRLGPGRQARHLAMNDFLVRCFQRANIPTIKETHGSHGGSLKLKNLAQTEKIKLQALFISESLVDIRSVLDNVTLNQVKYAEKEMQIKELNKKMEKFCDETQNRLKENEKLARKWSDVLKDKVETLASVVTKIENSVKCY
ncbi:hypothetical protein HELRODRAFT_179137 [Helobdella robusta]|uniref:Uncharacterized protein n=1 Tax=Helobdella robusta TaxID=6412 RepID=T1FE81_HELRO|nr:hypothetical protein HELRODRAFT_179137 [Helobdella robusta]ESN95667.1 hypothetical protein HELRODRAFT_179137 [Helobdella robusta]